MLSNISKTVFLLNMWNVLSNASLQFSLWSSPVVKHSTGTRQITEIPPQ